MDEARAVLGRLERIEELERGGAAAPELLGELRTLVLEAEAWARVDGDERARTAVSACADSLASEMIAM